MAVAQKEGRYHHGNLRQALLDAALVLVAERGIQGVTLREVARRAGVSHAAPYHHFADKAELVTALAVEGFTRLTAALQQAAAQPGDPLERLAAIGMAYVHFAQEQPAAFRLMFRPELRAAEGSGVSSSPAPDPATGVAGLAAFQVLLDAILDCQASGLVAPVTPASLALTAWATVHGMATILVDGAAEWTLAIVAPDGIDPLIAQVVQTLLVGVRAR